MLAVAEQLRALRLSVSTVFNITADHAWAVDDAICRAPGRVLPLNGGYCCGPKGARPPPSALWLPACSLRAAGPCQIFDRRECFRAGATIFKAALPNATYRPPLPTVAAGGCCGSNAGTELPNAGKGWSPPVTNVGFDLTGAKRRLSFKVAQNSTHILGRKSGNGQGTRGALPSPSPMAVQSDEHSTATWP